jgi:hypothetical protein
VSDIRKPCALLRLMAERQGQKITARDVAALLLAVSTMEALQQLADKGMAGYRDALHDLVTHKARAESLQDGMRALLEVHS